MVRPLITLTTDFGETDAYVGTMKGVILGICPEAALVDISHGVHPQAVRQAALLLSMAAPYFPEGTVHLVVVDPGVGSVRRAIAVQTGRATYVAPDNGVLAMALEEDPARSAVQLNDPHYHLARTSATFQGRDVFAPAAAHLAAGTDLRAMGEPIPVQELERFEVSAVPPSSDGSWLGEVLHIDHFGNLVTSFRGDLARACRSVTVAGQQIPGLSRTFSDVARGEMVAYVGSNGHLEIAVREGNAATRLGIDIGAPVRIIAPEADPASPQVAGGRQ